MIMSILFMIDKIGYVFPKMLVNLLQLRISPIILNDVTCKHNPLSNYKKLLRISTTYKLTFSVYLKLMRQL